MKRRVIVRPPAEEDIREIRQALDSVRAGLGDHFASRLRVVLERIEQMPELYAVIWRDVRAVRLHRFRYVVYYVVFDDRIEVLAVVHGARDAFAWRSRI